MREGGEGGGRPPGFESLLVHYAKLWDGGKLLNHSVPQFPYLQNGNGAVSTLGGRCKESVRCSLESA